jgi:hypothetical protein
MDGGNLKLIAVECLLSLSEICVHIVFKIILKYFVLDVKEMFHVMFFI